MNKTSHKTQFDNYAEDYRKHIAKALPPGLGEVDSYARLKVWHLCKAISCAFPGRRNISILDAGCGVGMADSYLKHEFPNITGFDVSGKSVELAGKANPELTYVSDAEGVLPFAADSFDVIFAMCVVHHVPPAQWNVFFNQLYGAMKPGGLLAIYEHNPWNPATRWVVSRCEFDRDATLLNSASCRSLAEAAGFKLAKARSILLLPLENDYWCRLERRTLSFLPFGAQYELTARK